MLVLLVLLYAGPAMFNVRYNLINTPLEAASTITIDSDPIKGAHTNKGYHYTLVFNTFIMMNLFNQLNCRKLESNEVNIFAGFFNNFLFLLILAGEFAL